MSKPDTPTEHRVAGAGAGVELSVLEVGPASGRTVVMLHGLRDTAWALLPIAQHLAQPDAAGPGFRVLITELRGHGKSGRSDAYAMPNFLLDLHAVLNQLSEQGCALFGHSLGGHIVTKFAALFPELVRALVVVEGLGPPRRPHEGDEAQEIEAYRHSLLSRLADRPSAGKPIRDLADVAARLCRNSPRLHPDEAERLAPHLVEEVNGTLRWAFDSRANSVFIGTNTTDNERFWRQVTAPTCVISGALSYEYWGSQMPHEDFTGHFAEGELEARAAQFRQHEHHWFEHSGHMVHYDEPQRLGQLTRQFLEQRYV